MTGPAIDSVDDRPRELRASMLAVAGLLDRSVHAHLPLGGQNAGFSFAASLGSVNSRLGSPRMSVVKCEKESVRIRPARMPTSGSPRIAPRNPSVGWHQALQ